jgi:transposase-like protein
LSPRPGRRSRPFEPQEDATIVAMRIDGASQRRIAAAIGRAKTSVLKRLRRLAEKDEQEEERERNRLSTGKITR